MDAHQPADYDAAVVTAMRALAAGNANDAQQKLCLDWIINQASKLYDMSYRPDGAGGARATDFHEGRRFVGNQIVKMLRSETLQAVEAKQAPKPKNEARGKP